MEWYSKRKLTRLEKEKLAREKEIETVTQKVIEKAIPPILNELKEKNGQQDARLDRLTKTSMICFAIPWLRFITPIFRTKKFFIMTKKY